MSDPWPWDVHTLNARAPDRRSGAVAVSLGNRGTLMDGTRPALVLIHGFANSRQDAARRYRQFLAALWAQAQALELSRQRDVTALEVFALHWPGDHVGDLPRHRLRSVVTFPNRVGPADLVGQQLAYAMLLSTRRRLVVVAHSLGCRAALRSLAVWKGDSELFPSGPAAGGNRTHVVLMAAAVPVDECVGSGVFTGQPEHARCSVLFSADDDILRWCFPPGQAQYDGSGEAVGLYGNPAQGRWDGRVKTHHRHGQYWESGLTAREVLSVLVADSVRSAGTARRDPFEPPPPAPPWPARVLGRRQLAERRLPGGFR